MLSLDVVSLKDGASTEMQMWRKSYFPLSGRYRGRVPASPRPTLAYAQRLYPDPFWNDAIEQKAAVEVNRNRWPNGIFIPFRCLPHLRSRHGCKPYMQFRDPGFRGHDETGGCARGSSGEEATSCDVSSIWAGSQRPKSTCDTRSRRGVAREGVCGGNCF